MINVTSSRHNRAVNTRLLPRFIIRLFQPMDRARVDDLRSSALLGQSQEKELPLHGIGIDLLHEL
jgi:hypothetical protein